MLANPTLVKHIASKDDWRSPKDSSTSWIDYWEKNNYSALLTNGLRCRNCGCEGAKNNPIIGAHVQKVNSDDKTVYIVPTCKECNSKGIGNTPRVFEVSECDLVPANAKKL